MRFHIRRLAVFALGSTCVVTILLNFLRPHHDADRFVPQIVEVEQRPLRPLSLNERLARYSGGNATTAAELPDRPNPAPIKRRPSPAPTQRKQEEADQDDENTVENELMSETVSGSQNEQIRRRYVRLPEQSRNGVESLWWNGNLDDNPNDRIEAQMRHVPRNYRPDGQKIKVIYAPGGLGNEPEGQEKFLTEQCPVNTCR